MVFATEALLAEHGNSIKDMKFAIQVSLQKHLMLKGFILYYIYSLLHGSCRDLEMLGHGLRDSFKREVVRSLQLVTLLVQLGTWMASILQSCSGTKKAQGV